MNNLSWKKVAISDICISAATNIQLNKIKGQSGDYSVYGASGYIQNIDYYQQDSEYLGIVKDGSGVGRVNIYPAYSSLLSTMQYILPKECCNIRFLMYVLRSLNLSSFSRGAAIPHIYYKDYCKINVFLPSIEEQEQIVSELDKIQAALDNKKEQLKKLDELIQSKFYEMFGDPVVNDKGWEVEKLGMQAKVKGGYAFKSSLFEASGIPVLRIGNINSGKLRLEPIVFYAEDEKLSKYLIYPNELVISLTGTAGKDDYANVCKVDDSFTKYYLNQRNAKIELSKNIVVEYMQYLLRDRDIKLKLTGINRGIRQGNISNKDIENLIIPLPPLPLQQAFAAYVEKVEQAKAIVNQEIAHLQELLNSRMDYYFRK